eukprot:scaffold196534_cov22-Tisochrysis_lutea.AAC.1
MHCARLVGLRRDELARHRHQVRHLGGRAGRLRHVHVHLVAVEVGVEPEGGAAHHHHDHAVAHHAHPVLLLLDPARQRRQHDGGAVQLHGRE